MKMHLSENDWLFINNMTYKIHEIEDFDKMRMEFLKSIELAVNYNRATFYLADKTRDRGLCDPVGINFTEDQLNLYLDEFLPHDYFKTVTSSPTSYVYRESDLFDPEIREATEYFKKAYEPLGLYYSLLLGLVYENEHLASLVFYRTKEEGNFSDTDIYILELLKNHLALRVSKEMGVYSLQTPQPSETESIQKLCVEKGLTEREIEVVEHLYKGDTTPEICDELYIAQTTLKKHITNSYKKLGIGCRAQLYKILK